MKYLIAIGSLLLIGVGVYAWAIPRSVDKPPLDLNTDSVETAVFAGGCFWCTEADFEKLDGVLEAESGYMGGKADTATYEITSSKTTDHREVVKVYYDPKVVSYKALVNYHLKHIDPTDNQGQFVDRGYVYSPAIFYNTNAEQQQAQQALVDLNNLEVFESTVAIPIEPLKPFYSAETYHQDYYLKNPVRYKFYRDNSGRTQFLEETWGP